MKGNSFIEVILTGFDNLQIASFERVVEGDSSRLTGYNRDFTGFLRFILIAGLFRYRIGSGHKVVDLKHAVVVSLYGLVDTVSRDSKGDTGNLTVFGSLYDLGRAIRNVNLHEALNGVIYFLSKGCQVLNANTGLILSVIPHDNATPLRIVFRGGNRDRTVGSSFSRNSEFVSAHSANDTGRTRLECVVSENTICIGQSRRVISPVPLKLNALCGSRGLRTEGRDFGVFLNAVNDMIVVTHDLRPQRMVCADDTQNSVIAAGINVTEIGVTLTDDGFPYQDLRSDNIRELFCIFAVLTAPRTRDGSGIAVFQNTTNMKLHSVAINRMIIFGRKDVPIGLVLLNQPVTDSKRRTGLDTVAGISIPRSDGINGVAVDIPGSPTVHIVLSFMSPICAIVCVAVTGKGEHGNFGFLSGGKSRRGPEADHSGEAHNKCKKRRCASLEITLFHSE